MKCEHKYVAMEDGTNDLFCVKCRKFAMQAAIKPDISSASLGLGGLSSINGKTTLEAMLEDIGVLLREEMQRDMMRATRSKGLM